MSESLCWCGHTKENHVKHRPQLLGFSIPSGCFGCWNDWRSQCKTYIERPELKARSSA